MSSDNDLVFLSITRQAQLIRERALSPVELVKAYLKRIAHYDSVLRAYVTVCAEQALAAAAHAESEIAAGGGCGPAPWAPCGLSGRAAPHRPVARWPPQVPAPASP